MKPTHQSKTLPSSLRRGGIFAGGVYCDSCAQLITDHRLATAYSTEEDAASPVFFSCGNRYCTGRVKNLLPEADRVGDALAQFLSYLALSIKIDDQTTEAISNQAPKTNPYNA